ncbi:Ras- protein Rab-2A [Boothiomyces sp. JEL0866]|nr:Ras- protein Rab-2A [Boothiomyces sp. JEL0866]
MNQFDYLFKYITVGDSGVGKSCLLLRLTNNEFLPTETTIGIEFGSTILNINQKKIKLQVWDTAGQESFRSISRAYYRGAIGCLLVFDVSRRETFIHLQSWLQDVLDHGNQHIKTVLVANKCDLQRQVSTAEAQEFATRNNLLYIETSAKSGQGVKESFTVLGETIFSDLKLERDHYNEQELKTLESSGVKVGPRKPLVVLGQSNQQQSCC